jgi:hypothetical protein
MSRKGLIVGFGLLALAGCGASPAPNPSGVPICISDCPKGPTRQEMLAGSSSKARNTRSPAAELSKDAPATAAQLSPEEQLVEEQMEAELAAYQAELQRDARHAQ